AFTLPLLQSLYTLASETSGYGEISPAHSNKAETAASLAEWVSGIKRAGYKGCMERLRETIGVPVEIEEEGEEGEEGEGESDESVSIPGDSLDDYIQGLEAHRDSAAAQISLLTERLEAAEANLTALADKHSKEIATLEEERDAEREAHAEQILELLEKRVVETEGERKKEGEGEEEGITDRKSTFSWIDPSFQYVSPTVNKGTLPCTGCATAARTISELQGTLTELETECNSLNERGREREKRVKHLKAKVKKLESGPCAACLTAAATVSDMKIALQASIERERVSERTIKNLEANSKAQSEERDQLRGTVVRLRQGRDHYAAQAKSLQAKYDEDLAECQAECDRLLALAVTERDARLEVVQRLERLERLEAGLPETSRQKLEGQMDSHVEGEREAESETPQSAETEDLVTKYNELLRKSQQECEGLLGLVNEEREARLEVAQTLSLSREQYEELVRGAAYTEQAYEAQTASYNKTLEQLGVEREARVRAESKVEALSCKLEGLTRNVAWVAGVPSGESSEEENTLEKDQGIERERDNLPGPVWCKMEWGTSDQTDAYLEQFTKVSERRQAERDAVQRDREIAEAARVAAKEAKQQAQQRQADERYNKLQERIRARREERERRIDKLREESQKRAAEVWEKIQRKKREKAEAAAEAKRVMDERLRVRAGRREAERVAKEEKERESRERERERREAAEEEARLR
ncbi:hypothetical protein KIPB_010393, partial [Kipferlia bialata]